jgi:hypothetical protein
MYNNLWRIHTNDQEFIKNVIYKHFSHQIKYVDIKTSRIEEYNETEKIYWTHIYYQKVQLEGLLSGYNSVNKRKLRLEDLYFINADGEVPELIEAHKVKNNNKY